MADHVGVQRPVEVDVEKRAQGRGRVAVSPVIPTNQEPDVALAFDLPAPDRADDSPAGDDRSRADGSALIFASCSRNAGRSRDGNAAIVLASGSAWNSNSVRRSASIVWRSADLGHHQDAARNNGTGAATPFSSTGPSCWNRYARCR